MLKRSCLKKPVDTRIFPATNVKVPLLPVDESENLQTVNEKQDTAEVPKSYSAGEEVARNVPSNINHKRKFESLSKEAVEMKNHDPYFDEVYLDDSDDDISLKVRTHSQESLSALLGSKKANTVYNCELSESKSSSSLGSTYYSCSEDISSNEQVNVSAATDSPNYFAPYSSTIPEQNHMNVSEPHDSTSSASYYSSLQHNNLSANLTSSVSEHYDSRFETPTRYSSPECTAKTSAGVSFSYASHSNLSRNCNSSPISEQHFSRSETPILYPSQEHTANVPVEVSCCYPTYNIPSSDRTTPAFQMGGGMKHSNDQYYASSQQGYDLLPLGGNLRDNRFYNRHSEETARQNFNGSIISDGTGIASGMFQYPTNKAISEYTPPDHNFGLFVGSSAFMSSTPKSSKNETQETIRNTNTNMNTLSTKRIEGDITHLNFPSSSLPASSHKNPLQSSGIVSKPERWETCATTNEFNSKSEGSLTRSSFNSLRRSWSYKRFPHYNLTQLLANGVNVEVFDTHCHLDFLFKRLNHKGTFKAFKSKKEATFPACFAGCVANFCEPEFISKKSSWECLLQEDGVWASFGIHPHHAYSYNKEVEHNILVALKHEKVVAFGEIGLDYSQNNHCSKEVQQRVFRQQLNIAVQNNKPLIIHCRDAQEDCLKIMEEVVPKYTFIHRHCFTGDMVEATSWMASFPNIYFGFTALVTFRNATDIHEVVRQMPLDKLLCETDAPYFIPAKVKTMMDPQEEQVSHPGMVLHVAAQIAALRGENFYKFLEAVRKNTKKMYNI